MLTDHRGVKERKKAGELVVPCVFGRHHQFTWLPSQQVVLQPQDTIGATVRGRPCLARRSVDDCQTQGVGTEHHGCQKRLFITLKQPLFVEAPRRVHPRHHTFEQFCTGTQFLFLLGQRYFVARTKHGSKVVFKPVPGKARHRDGLFRILVP